MTISSLLEKSISINGINGALWRSLVPVENHLPSRSQLYRFREIAFTGDFDKIKTFLTERMQKKKAARQWGFELDHMNFNDWIVEKLIAPIENALTTEDIKTCLQTGMGIGIHFSGISDDGADPDLDTLKSAILKKLLLAFLDQTILLASGVSCKTTIQDNHRPKMEVLVNDRKASLL